MDRIQPEKVLQGLLGRYPALLPCEESIRQAAACLCGCFQQGSKLLVCGNGGSAADSEHIVGELMKSFRFRRPVDEEFSRRYVERNACEVPSWLEGALPAISLVSHTALSSAFGNDRDSVGVYAQQVYGYGLSGDVLLGISTSGSSANVLEAAKVAKAKEMCVISLTGDRSTELTETADVAIMVPEVETYRVQELHLPVYHCLCAMVEAAMFGECR